MATPTGFTDEGQTDELKWLILLVGIAALTYVGWRMVSRDFAISPGPTPQAAKQTPMPVAAATATFTPARDGFDVDAAGLGDARIQGLPTPTPPPIATPTPFAWRPVHDRMFERTLQEQGRTLAIANELLSACAFEKFKRPESRDRIEQLFGDGIESADTIYDIIHLALMQQQLSERRMRQLYQELCGPPPTTTDAETEERP